jgi:hypothetical protein
VHLSSYGILSGYKLLRFSIYISHLPVRSFLQYTFALKKYKSRDFQSKKVEIYTISTQENGIQLPNTLDQRQVYLKTLYSLYQVLISKASHLRHRGMDLLASGCGLWDRPGCRTLCSVQCRLRHLVPQALLDSCLLRRPLWQYLDDELVKGYPAPSTIRHLRHWTLLHVAANAKRVDIMRSLIAWAQVHMHRVLRLIFLFGRS